MREKNIMIVRCPYCGSKEHGCYDAADGSRKEYVCLKCDRIFYEEDC